MYLHKNITKICIFMWNRISCINYILWFESFLVSLSSISKKKYYVFIYWYIKIRSLIIILTVLTLVWQCNHFDLLHRWHLALVSWIFCCFWIASWILNVTFVVEYHSMNILSDSSFGKESMGRRESGRGWLFEGKFY